MKRINGSAKRQAFRSYSVNFKQVIHKCVDDSWSIHSYIQICMRNIDQIA